MIAQAPWPSTVSTVIFASDSHPDAGEAVGRVLLFLFAVALGAVMVAVISWALSTVGLWLAGIGAAAGVLIMVAGYFQTGFWTLVAAGLILTATALFGA